LSSWTSTTKTASETYTDYGKIAIFALWFVAFLIACDLIATRKKRRAKREVAAAAIAVREGEEGEDLEVLEVLEDPLPAAEASTAIEAPRRAKIAVGEGEEGEGLEVPEEVLEVLEDLDRAAEARGPRGPEEPVRGPPGRIAWQAHRNRRASIAWQGLRNRRASIVIAAYVAVALSVYNQFTCKVVDVGEIRLEDGYWIGDLEAFGLWSAYTYDGSTRSCRWGEESIKLEDPRMVAARWMAVTATVLGAATFVALLLPSPAAAAVASNACSTAAAAAQAVVVPLLFSTRICLPREPYGDVDCVPDKGSFYALTAALYWTIIAFGSTDIDIEQRNYSRPILLGFLVFFVCLVLVLLVMGY